MTLLLVIYGTLVAALLASITVGCLRALRRQIRHWRLSRELRRVHEAAYRERPRRFTDAA